RAASWQVAGVIERNGEGNLLAGGGVQRIRTSQGERPQCGNLLRLNRTRRGRDRCERSGTPGSLGRPRRFERAEPHHGSERKARKQRSADENPDQRSHPRERSNESCSLSDFWRERPVQGRFRSFGRCGSLESRRGCRFDPWRESLGDAGECKLISTRQMLHWLWWLSSSACKSPRRQADWVSGWPSHS